MSNENNSLIDKVIVKVSDIFFVIVFTPLVHKILIRWRYSTHLNRYIEEPLFKYLYEDGVRIWYPILRKNFGVTMNFGVYAEYILRLTMSGACPIDYLKKNSDIGINRPTTELEEDEKSIQFLKELDPTREYRKELRSWYFAEESRRRFDGRF